MDMLHERLAELAEDAPTRGVPPAELWARGRRTHRIRAAAVGATLLVVGAVGTGIGVRIADVDGNRSYPSTAGPVGITLPIEYPVGEELPDLGDTPGPLAAIWLSPRVGGGAPEAVGLVAATGTFGTLPIDDLWNDDPAEPNDMVVALSADGRRIAYFSSTAKLIILDLVSGESYLPPSEFAPRFGVRWVDATHLIGLVCCTDGSGFVWEPGTAPKLVDYWTYGEGFDLWVSMDGSGPQPDPGEDSCTSPILLDGTGKYGKYTPGWGYVLEMPVLCDLLGIIGSETLLGHWNSDRPNDGNGTVVALDIRGADSSFEDPALRRVVATAEAPERVTFATDLIRDALDAEGSAS
jgi:hypothetical protein